MRIRIIWSVTRVCSSGFRQVHTLSAGIVFMRFPPRHSFLEGSHKVFNGFKCQAGRARDALHPQIRAIEFDIRHFTREELNLAIPAVSRQPREPQQPQRSPKERMARIGDRDLALAGLGDQRCILMGEVCPFPAGPADRRWIVG